MEEQNSRTGLFQKGGRLAAIVGFVWIALNIIVPLALLRLPIVRQWAASLEQKLPFDIPGIG